MCPTGGWAHSDAKGEYSNALTFHTTSNGSLSEAMRIHYNGNVGIGTTKPFTDLDIRKSGGARLRLENSNTSHSYANQDESIEFCTDYATTGFIHQRGEDLRLGVTGNSGNICFFTKNSTGYPNQSSSSAMTQSFFNETYTSWMDSPKMIITSDGKVGIGTKTPDAQIDLWGPTNNPTTATTVSYTHLTLPTTPYV